MKTFSSRPIDMKAFTLIELLIVVAIIAILAAIAVPNFLEAQSRAKVSRCLADVRSLRTSLECYRVDYTAYPETDGDQLAFTSGKLGVCRLTTPIAYMTSIPTSPFKEKFGTSGGVRMATIRNSYLYTRKIDTAPATGIRPSYKNDRVAYLGVLLSSADAEAGEYMIKSVGPDNNDDRDSAPTGFGANAKVYDPTNGTVSRGDVVIFSDRPGTGKN